MFLCLFYFYYSPYCSLYPIRFYYLPCLRFAVPYRVLLLTLSKVRYTLSGFITHLAVRDNGLRFGRGVKK